MSKKIVLLGDLGTDHQGFPPTPVIAGSPDVRIDGKPVARVGDPLAPHSKPKHPPHPHAIAAGSASGTSNPVAGGPVASSMDGPTLTSTPANGQPNPERERPGFHVVQAPMSKTELLSALYGDASLDKHDADSIMTRRSFDAFEFAAFLESRNQEIFQDIRAELEAL